jgi:hypothetical protein
MGSMNNPFFTTGAISERRHFVGRDRNLREIFDRASMSTPPSLNLVGAARSGKSSLLRQVCRTYETVMPRPGDVVAVYVEFGRANSQSETAFYQAIATALLEEIPRKRTGLLQQFKRSELEKPLKVEPFDRLAFDRALRAWRKANILPILCLDHFEYLLDKPEVFPNDFYEVLRALVDDGMVMLAIASRQTISDYSRGVQQFTSRFFNLFQTLRVEDLDEAAAWDLVRLPSSDDPALTEANQAIAFDWGGCDAFRLQAAGWCLFEAQRDGSSVKLARRRFEEMTARRPQGWRDWRNWSRLVFWRLPIAVTTSSTWVGENAKELQKVVPGAVIILVVVLLGMGRLTPETLGTVWKLFKDPIELLTKPAEPEGESKSP